MEERIVQKILTTINTAHNKQVNRLIKSERDAILNSDIVNPEKGNEYEMKIKLMAEQIAKLTAENKRKVTLDKRKLKFAKD